jgi:glycosyltransferase involved in cell wall biosynthesis
VRVLVDFRPALTARTGVGEYLYNLMQALARRADRLGVSLTLFSSSWKDRVREEDRAAMAPARMVDRRVPVRLLNALWHWTGQPPADHLARGRFDILHSPHPLLLPGRHGARLVTIHDLDFLVHPERARAEIRRDYPRLVRAHAQTANQVIVSSRYAAREVERRLDVPAERISLCRPIAPDWPVADRNARSRANGYVLFLGTLEPRKNVDTLLRTYASLLTRLPDFPPLVLAGKATPDAGAWLRMLEEPPLAGRARYLGYVADSQRPALYAGASLLVLPSLEEGFGMPVLEAMAQGVPVVASTRGALPEVLGDVGIAIEPEDEDALAAAIERMVTDEAYAAACAARGRLRARQFSADAAVEALLDAYRLAVEARG